MFVFIIFSILAVIALLVLKHTGSKKKTRVVERCQELPTLMTHLKEKSVFRFKSKLFLYSWVMSFRVYFGRLTNVQSVHSQINLLAIRQALGLMLFGRGIIHG